MNWAAMMGLAVERFGLAPDGFWRLSLREWRMLTAAPEPAAMGRDELERLAARWPDGVADGDNHG